MDIYGVTVIQNKPSILKEMDVSKIVDKRSHKDVGYFIAAKYADYLTEVIAKIESDQKISKLNRLKSHQDSEFCELGIDDGIEGTSIN